MLPGPGWTVSPQTVSHLGFLPEVAACQAFGHGNEKTSYEGLVTCYQCVASEFCH